MHHSYEPYVPPLDRLTELDMRRNNFGPFTELQPNTLQPLLPSKIATDTSSSFGLPGGNYQYTIYISFNSRAKLQRTYTTEHTIETLKKIFKNTYEKSRFRRFYMCVFYGSSFKCVERTGDAMSSRDLPLKLIILILFFISFPN